MKTWKQKIGKKLLRHVAETTSRSTLAEVKRNMQHHTDVGIVCFECRTIAEKLGLDQTGKKMVMP